MKPGPFPNPAVLCHLLAVTHGLWPFLLLCFHCFHFFCKLCRLTVLTFSSREILCTHRSCHVRREFCGCTFTSQWPSKGCGWCCNTSEWKTFTRSGPNMLGASRALRSDLKTDPPSRLMQSSCRPASSPAGMSFACSHKCSFQKGACRRDIALSYKTKLQ